MWVGDFWLRGSVGWLPATAGMKGKSHIGKKCLFIHSSLIPSLVCTYVLCQPHDNLRWAWLSPPEGYEIGYSHSY